LLNHVSLPLLPPVAAAVAPRPPAPMLMNAADEPGVIPAIEIPVVFAQPPPMPPLPPKKSPLPGRWPPPPPPMQTTSIGFVTSISTGIVQVPLPGVVE
jgi:hypothetical protein